MKVNQVELEQVILESIRLNRNLLIYGIPGVGKTDIVGQACAKAGADLHVIISSLRDPTHATGIPFPVADPELGQISRFFIPEEISRMVAATRPLVVFLDELGNAPMAVQCSYCNLIQAREIDGRKLSPHVRFIAASNRREHRSGANAISTALLNRCTVLELEPTAEHWARWAARSKLPAAWIAFVLACPEHLIAWKPDGGDAQPTPRSVASAATFWRDTQLDLQSPLVRRVLEGTIGEASTLAFYTFLSARAEIPTVAEILENPGSARVPGTHTLRYRVAQTLAHHTAATNTTVPPAVETYLQRLGPEFTAIFATIFEQAKGQPQPDQP